MHAWKWISGTFIQLVILPLFNWIGHIYIQMEVDVVNMWLKRQDADKN
jgi:hypothetical protein